MEENVHHLFSSVIWGKGSHPPGLTSNQEDSGQGQCLWEGIVVSASVGYLSHFSSGIDNDRDFCGLGSTCQLLGLDLLVSENYEE